MSDKRYADNKELIESARAGDRNALEAIMINNAGLVRSIAVRFIGRSVDYDDLIQLGNLGMLKAVKSYDAGYNTAFSTYAVPLIIGEIKRYLRDDGIIRVGRDTKKLGAIILKEREKYLNEHGSEPSVDELAAICNVSRSDLVYALEASMPISSLSEPAGDSGLSLESTIADSDEWDPALIEKIALNSAISKLQPDRQKIIYLRYYKNLTQQECAKILGITQVKISREEKKIIAELRAMLS